MRSLSQLAASGFGTIPEGTIIPCWPAAGEKRPGVRRLPPLGAGAQARKYYSLTPAGEAELQQFIQNYAELSHAVGNLLSALKGDADHE